MNRLREVKPEDVGIAVSKKNLLVVQGGAFDFYDLHLLKKQKHSVAISIRASLGAVTVRPDTVHIRENDTKPVSIVVLSPSLRGDSEEFDLVHNVTSRSPELDGLVFKLKVYVVEREGNGDLYSLGYNDRYQLGHKQPEVPPHVRRKYTSVPGRVKLPAKTAVGAMGGSLGHSAVVLTDGSIFGWGSHSNGKLGKDPSSIQDATDEAIMEPSRISFFFESFVLHVACGDEHTVVLTSVGEVWTFGATQDGRLGIGKGHAGYVAEPQQVHWYREVRVQQPGKPSKGSDLESAYSDDGLALAEEVYRRERCTPRVAAIAAGQDFTVVLAEGGGVAEGPRGVFAWGCGRAGSLGLGDKESRWEPTQISDAGLSVLKISCGRYHTLLLDQSGAALATGCGSEGRLGVGDQWDRHVPTAVKGSGRSDLPRFRQLICGGAHSGALDENLDVWVWGSNTCYQLGLLQRLETSAAACQLVPRRHVFFEGKGICALSFGEQHSCALTLYGLVYTWGSNEKGQLGHDRDTELMPRVVRSLMHSPVVQIAAVGKHTFALTGFEHNGTNQQLEAWVASVQEQDEKRRKDADKAFFAFLEEEGRKGAATASKQWTRARLEAEVRGKEMRAKTEERAAALQKARGTQEALVWSDRRVEKLSATFSAARRHPEPPRGAPPGAPSPARRPTAPSAAGSREGPTEGAVTYFEPEPTQGNMSRASALIGMLRPTDVLRRAAVPCYALAKDEYLTDPHLAAEICPGVYRWSPGIEVCGYDYVLSPSSAVPARLGVTGAAQEDGEAGRGAADGKQAVAQGNITLFGDFFTHQSYAPLLPREDGKPEEKATAPSAPVVTTV